MTRLTIIVLLVLVTSVSCGGVPPLPTTATAPQEASTAVESSPTATIVPEVTAVPTPQATDTPTTQPVVEVPTTQPVEVPAPQAPSAPTTACVVPDVVGLEHTAAGERLTGLGLEPLSSGAVDGTVPAGTVISQIPAAGTELDSCGGPVTIVISQGPPVEADTTEPAPEADTTEPPVETAIVEPAPVMPEPVITPTSEEEPLIATPDVFLEGD